MRPIGSTLEQFANLRTGKHVKLSWQWDDSVRFGWGEQNLWFLSNGIWLTRMRDSVFFSFLNLFLKSLKWIVVKPRNNSILSSNVQESLFLSLNLPTWVPLRNRTFSYSALSNRILLYFPRFIYIPKCRCSPNNRNQIYFQPRKRYAGKASNASSSDVTEEQQECEL